MVEVFGKEFLKQAPHKDAMSDDAMRKAGHTYDDKAGVWKPPAKTSTGALPLLRGNATKSRD